MGGNVLYKENEKNNSKVAELVKNLESGMEELFSSENYKNYLTTMSRFHNYSYGNILLILLQKPDATHVAGYYTWKNKFGRHVNKGEKAIYVLAPVTYKVKKTEDSSEENSNGNDEIRIVAYKSVPVYDISQTSGKPLPSLKIEELSKSVDSYSILQQAIISSAGIPIIFKDIAGSAKGYYSRADKSICIKAGMSESQTIKTMIHELAHSILHSNRGKSRSEMEVEAESVAYVVSQYYSVDTAEYSFSYIGSWSAGKGIKLLKNSLDLIQETADLIISKVNKYIDDMCSGIAG